MIGIVGDGNTVARIQSYNIKFLSHLVRRIHRRDHNLLFEQQSKSLCLSVIHAFIQSFIQSLPGAHCTQVCQPLLLLKEPAAQVLQAEAPPPGERRCQRGKGRRLRLTRPSTSLHTQSIKQPALITATIKTALITPLIITRNSKQLSRQTK